MRDNEQGAASTAESTGESFGELIAGVGQAAYGVSRILWGAWSTSTSVIAEVTSAEVVDQAVEILGGVAEGVGEVAKVVGEVAFGAVELLLEG